MKLVKSWLINNFELVVWISSLLVLYSDSIISSDVSLCPLATVGFEHCPGCGLGHSIHYFLHFDFNKGFEEHYLGGFALIAILYRIIQLLFNNLNFNMRYE